MSEEVKQEIQVQQPQHPQTLDSQSIGLTPRTFGDAWRFAKMIAMSDLAPKDYKSKPENVLVAIQMGAEVGLSPMAAIQNIAVINGRPSIWGDAALAIVQVHKSYVAHNEYYEGTGESKVAVFEVERKGSKLYTVRFSVADAKKAGLWGKAGPWTNYSDRMLQMRARGFGLRDKFADALRGLILAEEAMDIPPQFMIDAKTETAASQLPAEIKRKSELEAAPDEVLAQAKIANEKLEQRRNEEPEPSVKRQEAQQTDLEPAGETLRAMPQTKGVPMRFE